MDTKWIRLPKLWKAWLDVLQGLGTVIALIAALWWFHEQRFTSLNLKLEQTVTQRPLPSDPSQVLLAIEVHATNIGKVGIDLKENTGKLVVSPVFTDHDGALIGPSAPLDKLPDSRNFTSLLLQPGEGDQVGLFLVRVANSRKAVKIASYYKAQDTGQSWTIENVVDLKDPANERCCASVSSPGAR